MTTHLVRILYRAQLLSAHPIQATINDLWLENIVEYDIKPMLREYWFDNDSKYQTAVDKLLRFTQMTKDKNIFILDIYYMLTYAFS